MPSTAPGSIRLYDAHNHLQSESFAADVGSVVAEAVRAGLKRMVVNGATEEDWPAVADLARQFPCVLPSFGLHPRYLRERGADWRPRLLRLLDEMPAAVGEIGLDRGMENHDLPGQEEVFVWQLRIAAERNLPASIHCLRAWGRLYEILRDNPRPARGFLLHSYGGSREMIGGFAKLGAYFSISGQFAQDWKKRQRGHFHDVPRERLLIETDAPFMLPPGEWMTHPMNDPATGEAIQHPANIGAIYRYVAGFLGEPIEAIAARVEENFLRLFGGL
jgi:TatD DNase family protein